MDNKRFELLPGMDVDTFETWCKKRNLTETDLIFIFKSVKYNPEYVPEVVTVPDVAKYFGKSEQHIRVLLQKGMLPFGRAEKLHGRYYTYIIFPEKFRQYCGEMEGRLIL